MFLVIFGTFGTVVTFGTPVTCEPDMCCQPHRFPFVTDNSSCRQVPLVDYSFSESDSDCIVPGVDDDIDCDTSHTEVNPKWPLYDYHDDDSPGSVLADNFATGGDEESVADIEPTVTVYSKDAHGKAKKNRQQYRSAEEVGQRIYCEPSTKECSICC